MSKQLIQAAEKALKTMNRMEYDWSPEEKPALAELGNAIMQEKGESTRYVYFESYTRQKSKNDNSNEYFTDDSNDAIDLVIYDSKGNIIEEIEDIPRFISSDVITERCEENDWEYIR